MTPGRGLLVVLAGPSGAGRGSVLARVRGALPDAVTSVPVTTRQPRPEERDGVEYRFLDRDHFEQLIDDDELLEWAECAGNLYGTPQAPAVASVAAGNVVLVDAEVEVASQVGERFGGSLVVLVLPRPGGPDEDAFDVTVVNDDVDGAVARVLDAITSARDGS